MSKDVTISPLVLREGSWIKVNRGVFEEIGLKNVTNFFVYFYICCNFNVLDGMTGGILFRRGECILPLNTLSFEFGICKESAIKALLFLLQTGYIESLRSPDDGILVVKLPGYDK